MRKTATVMSVGPGSTARQEYSLTGANQDMADGDKWRAQTFTPQVGHTLTKVVLKLYRIGSPGTITVSIEETSGGEPTGVQIAVGTTNGDTLTVSSSGEWRAIDLGVALTQNVMYAILVKALAGDASNQCGIVTDNSNPYAGGTRLYTQNAGSSWTDVPTHDLAFEEWGW